MVDKYKALGNTADMSPPLSGVAYYFQKMRDDAQMSR